MVARAHSSTEFMARTVIPSWKPLLETGVDGVQQFPLPILLAEDVFMGPSVPVCDRLPPGCGGR